MPSKWLHKLDTFYLPSLCWKCSSEAISPVMLDALTWANTGHIRPEKNKKQQKKKTWVSIQLWAWESTPCECLCKSPSIRDDQHLRPFRQLPWSRSSSEWTRVSNQPIVNSKPKNQHLICRAGSRKQYGRFISFLRGDARCSSRLSRLVTSPRLQLFSFWWELRTTTVALIYLLKTISPNPTRCTNWANAWWFFTSACCTNIFS